MTAVIKTTSVDLTELQLAHIRQLLFVELHAAAKILAEQAHYAHEGHVGRRENIAGDDAHGTFHHRTRVAAELLDIFGWSVLTDTSTIVTSERQEGGE